MSWGGKEVLEVVLLAIAFYAFIRHLQTTRGGGLLAGFILLIMIAGVFAVLLRNVDFEHLQWIADAALPAIGIALLVIFQAELRLAITRLGNMRLVNMVERLFGARRPLHHEKMVESIISAVERLARTRTGALIAIEGRHAIEGFGETGVRVGGDVTARLLETVFYKGTPLHDGAVLIIRGRLMYASCHLPSAPESPELSRDLGTRHRAALGMSEQSDALVIVVSEETGRISIASGGKLETGVSTSFLRDSITRGIVAQLERVREKVPIDDEVEEPEAEK